MSSSKTKIFFRADGNSELGLGHVVRSLALVEMLKSDFDCTFLTRTPDKELIKLIESYCTLIPLESNVIYSDEASFLKKFVENRDIMVLDGYHFDSDYQKIIKSYVYKLVTIDDDARFDIHADLLINHGNPSIAGNYRLVRNSKLLLGPDYLLVRHNFREATKLQRKITKIDSLFICMGGADPFDITSKMLLASLTCSFINKIIIVTGNAYKHNSNLSNHIKSIKDKNIVWKQNINSEQMISSIHECEIAASTASSIAMEIACVKAGMILGTVAENQYNIHNHLVSSGCAQSVNDLSKASIREIALIINKLNNIDFIESMILNQARLFDGRSDERILQEFKLLAPC